MAQIVNLDELVGGDLVFKYNDQDYKIPGDVSTAKVFEMFQAFSELQGMTLTEDEEGIARAQELINSTLLSLFQVRQPDMEELPFGVRTLPIVIQEIMKLFGVDIVDDGDGSDALPPAPTSRRSRTTKSSQTPKRAVPKSRRSSGSRSS